MCLTAFGVTHWPRSSHKPPRQMHMCLGMLAENPGMCSLDYDLNALLSITPSSLPLLAPLIKANEDIIKLK